MIYTDTETCGLVGPMVLLQWAEDDGEINLHEIWNRPIPETLELIEYICTQDVCGFNLVFDWFHYNKIYNILRVLRDNGYSGIPTVSAVAKVEEYAPAQWCLKPKSALDLMLYARRTAYQHTMGRKSITLRHIPTVVADKLATVLKERVPLPAISFAKRPRGYKWEVSPVEGKPELSNIVLKFAGSSSLRALAADALGEDKADWPTPKEIIPTELEWKPYGQNGKLPWGRVISAHIAMWSTNEKARFYAWKDVDLTRKLRYFFSAAEPGDTDSTLACAIGAARWRGFEIDHKRIPEFETKYAAEAKTYPTSAAIVLRLLKQAASPEEALVITNTKKTTLEELERNGSTEKLKSLAKGIRAARRAKYRLGLVNRLKRLNRLHPDFKVIGTKSNRQSGGSETKGKKSINPQGIPRGELRELFAFHDPTIGEKLFGGDAKSYEVTIIDAVFPDPTLHADLVAGKNFHALMGEIWYGHSYDHMMTQKALDTGNTDYDKAKSGDFAYFYGAEANKMAQVLQIDDPEDSMRRFRERYGELYRKREEVAMQFCSMRQPNGIGTRVIWAEPAEYVESIFGFRRYFTIENKICRAMFEIANNPKLAFTPEEIANAKSVRLVRREERGSQTAIGALQSALYNAAFQLQAACMRAACNHKIQAPGGEICKEFQRALVDLQPIGVHEWVCRAFNMHDELLAVTNGSVDTAGVRDRVIARFRTSVPLLAWDWKPMRNWGDKGK